MKETLPILFAVLAPVALLSAVLFPLLRNLILRSTREAVDKENDQIAAAISFLASKGIRCLPNIASPGVELEKAVEDWRHDHFGGKRDGHYSGEYLERSSQVDLARHIAELQREQMLKDVMTALVNQCNDDFLDISISAKEYRKRGLKFRGGDEIEVLIIERRG
ncbi:MAG: hypothetical protein K6E35_07840 [Bacteroidales bacterium]|nr:hypothetical protein [Bacteroidales bacterium]